MSNQAASIAQSAQVQSLYNQYFGGDVRLTEESLEAFNDALYAICNNCFDLFEQVCMQLGIA